MRNSKVFSLAMGFAFSLLFLSCSDDSGKDSGDNDLNGNSGTEISSSSIVTDKSSSSSGTQSSDSYYEDDINWQGSNNGTLEVFNGSNKDIVLFIGQVPKSDDIIGGVRSGKSAQFDISKYVSDFSVGGYTIIRGMTIEEYNSKKLDINNAKWEFNSMAIYKAGRKYRINIDPSFTGDYVVRLTNKAKIGLELRKNSPQGEKVAYLPAMIVNQLLCTQTTETMTLFPVYVIYNKSTGEVSTLNAEDLPVSVSPRLATDPTKIITYYFPSNEEEAWSQVVKKLKSSVAYISVTNNIANQSVYLTNAGSQWFTSQEGYEAINPGESLMFEVKAGDWDEDTQEGGQKLNLIADYSGHTKQIPIRFADENELPLIKNGYNYTVSIEPDLNNVGNYKAIINETNKRNLEEVLMSF